MIRKWMWLLLSVGWCFADESVEVEMEIQNKTIASVLGKYQDLNRTDNARILTGRVDHIVRFAGWEAFFRLEVPYVWLRFLKAGVLRIDDSGLVTLVPAEGGNVVVRESKNGLGDLLVQAQVTTPGWKGWKLGIGSQVVFPSATKPELGTGKYLVRPVGMIWRGLGEESWFAFVGKYQFSFGKGTPLPVLYLQPILNVGLPKGWFVALSSEMQRNGRTGKWFVPADVLVGKMWNEKVLATAEYKVGIVRDYPLLKQEVELSVGVAF